MKIGITGGIGSGKSYICQRLKTRGIEVYDCDSAAKRLIRTSDSIRRQLTQLIGEDTYIGESLNKMAVARFLLASERNAQAIDFVDQCLFDGRRSVGEGIRRKIPAFELWVKLSKHFFIGVPRQGLTRIFIEFVYVL